MISYEVSLILSRSVLVGFFLFWRCMIWLGGNDDVYGIWRLLYIMCLRAGDMHSPFFELNLGDDDRMGLATIAMAVLAAEG